MMAPMDDRRVGRIVREVRIRHRWRQADLAAACGSSQSVISRIELGHLDDVTLPTLKAVGRALNIRIGVDAWWRGGEVDRLLDRGHAALVEHAASALRAAGWTVRVEVTFNERGERGSADLVGWHPGYAAMCIGECKTRFGDVQAAHATFDRKVRVLPRVLRRDEGWAPASIGRLLVIADTHANRDVITRHAATFDTTWPHRTAATQRWIRQPATEIGGGILFVPPSALDLRAGVRVVERVRLS